MNRQVLKTLLPNWQMGLILLGTVLVTAGGAISGLGYGLINLAFIFPALKFSILLHESGHLLFGKLVGATPRRMVLGRGNEVARTKVAGINVILHEKLFSGLAFSVHNEKSYNKAGLMLQVAGGFLSNFMFASLLYLIFGFNRTLTEGINFANLLIMMNALLGLSAMVPYRINLHGMKLPSDGLKLLQIPGSSKPNLANLIYGNEIMNGYELLEAKKYQEALEFFERLAPIMENEPAIKVNTSVAHMKLGNFESAYQLMLEAMEKINQHHLNYAMKYMVCNNLAWICLLVGKMKDADKFSEMALAADRKSPHISTTRGAVLIENGRYSEGIALLEQHVDFNFPASTTLTCSTYLGLAYHMQGDYKMAEKYFNFLKSHEAKLEADERHLYNSVIRRTAG